jgi:hypothetical protein
MDKDFALITELMNGLADARATLNDCLSTIARDDRPARKQIADTLTQQIADTVKEIDVARLKVLTRITAGA